MATVRLDHTTPSQQERRFMVALDALIVGQKRAKKRLVRMLMYANSQNGKFRDKNKPAGILFLLGPSGVGKSYIAKALAQIIFGNPRAFTNIDCTQFPNQHDISALIGAKPGYIGFDAKPILNQESLDKWGYELECAKNKDKIDLMDKLYDELTGINNQWKKVSTQFESLSKKTNRTPEEEKNLQNLIRMTYDFKEQYDSKDKLVRELEARYGFQFGGHYPSIVLFDEIEKAHRTLYNILLRVFEDGAITIHFKNEDKSTNSEEVYFHNTFFILTSNVGQEDIRKLLKGGVIGMIKPNQKDNHKDIYNRVMTQIEKQFPTEFLGRIGKENMIILDVWTRDNLEEALERLLIPELLSSFKQAMPIELIVEDTVKEFLVNESYDTRSRASGMRALKSVFKKQIIEPLSVLSENGSIVKGDTIFAKLVSKDGVETIEFYREELGIQKIGNHDLKIKKNKDNHIKTFEILKL